MEPIIPLVIRDEGTVNCLIAVWESAVRATHDFLTAGDIEAIRPDAAKAVAGIEHLYGYKTGDTITGFIGVEAQRIEMLFVDATARGQGIGRKLVAYAKDHLGAKYVDVNEQNGQGVGFYERMGFACLGRSELDGEGRPFPLLHMEIVNG